MDSNLGDVKMGYEIGKVGRTRYTWVMCPVCKEKRWALKKTGNVEGSTRLCRQCAILEAKHSFRLKN